MIARRDLIIGGACVAAAGTAYGLTPRRHVSLLGGMALQQIVPAQVDGWSARDVSDLVAPPAESLSVQLYNEVLERIYQRASDGAEVMMLVAHGNTETNDLQLHRPEGCYPAFGYRLSDDQEGQVSLARGVSLPVRTLVANAPGRQENIAYWSRLGEFLPGTYKQERIDRLKTAFAGYIADGVLVRFSMLGGEPAEAFATLKDFIPQWVGAVPAARRSALIGTQLAASMAASGK